MEYQEIIQVLEKNMKDYGVQPYRVKTKDGKYLTKRFFKHKGIYCLMKPNAHRYGHPLYELPSSAYRNWVSLKPILAKDNDALVKLFRKRVGEGIKLLAKSNMWPNIKAELESLQKLEDDEIKAIAVGEQDAVSKYEWAHSHEIYGNFIAKRCWISPRYLPFERDNIIDSIEHAVENNDEFTTRWRKDYDNTVNIIASRGYYSEEYRGCANGHYYILFDATHAIFCEND